MSVTQAVLMEMERCRKALLVYQERANRGDAYGTREHAAASRATLDLTRLLAKWRKTPVDFNKEK